jgi:hypothetical protein
MTSLETRQEICFCLVSGVPAVHHSKTSTLCTVYCVLPMHDITRDQAGDLFLSCIGSSSSSSFQDLHIVYCVLPMHDITREQAGDMFLSCIGSSDSCERRGPKK